MPPTSFLFLTPPLALYTPLVAEHGWGQERELQACGTGKSIIAHNALSERPSASSAAPGHAHSQALPLALGGESSCSIEELARLRCLLLCPGLTKVPSGSPGHAMGMEMMDLGLVSPSCTSESLSRTGRYLRVRDPCQGVRAGSGFGNASLLYSLSRSQSDNSSDLGT